MSKAKRGGKVFIDHFRNRRTSTTVGPYSTRARPGAAVSAPVAWDELKETRGGDEFDIPLMMQRISRQRKDPWADFHKIKQSLTAEHIGKGK
jgi:bifunctional non-homologous end joining protein LigD